MRVWAYTNHAGHLIEKPELTFTVSETLSPHPLPGATSPKEPKKIRTKNLKERNRFGDRRRGGYIGVAAGMIMNWELRNVKPGGKNLRMVKKFLRLKQAKR